MICLCYVKLCPCPQSNTKNYIHELSVAQICFLKLLASNHMHLVLLFPCCNICVTQHVNSATCPRTILMASSTYFEQKSGFENISTFLLISIYIDYFLNVYLVMRSWLYVQNILNDDDDKDTDLNKIKCQRSVDS